MLHHCVADVTMLSFNNWITYNPSGSTEEEENEVNNKGSNKKSNIAKIDDDNHKNPIKLLPIVGKFFCLVVRKLRLYKSNRICRLKSIKYF